MTAGDDDFVILSAGETNLAVQDNDVPGAGKLDPFATEIVVAPGRGTATVQKLKILYTPNPGETTGADSFVYRSCDTTGDCDTATVTLTLAVE